MSRQAHCVIATAMINALGLAIVEVILYAGQPGESGRDVDDRNWRRDEAFRIVGHDGVTAAELRCGCADGVFKIGPAEG